MFDDLTATIGPKDRVGLVGKNGAGKSSLLKLLARLSRPDEGDIVTPNGYRIAYLPQEGIATSGQTVYDEIAHHAFSKQIELDKRIHALSDEISSREDYESDAYLDLLHELSDSNDAFLHLGGATMKAEIETVTSGLGFSPDDSNRMCEEFSGGWQMRIELAKILLSKPDCILLDEPTNHLDIESIQWLENFLKNYEGSVVLVSHDRAFLDTVTNRTMEISLGKIEDYNASYSRYVEMRVERRSLLESAYANQQREIAQQERFIERFRSKASLATRVQSRIKLLDKVERIELEDEDTAAINFRFPAAPRSGRVAVETKSLTKAYGSKVVLNSIDFALERGDRVAFVGKNGMGKTTLSRIIASKDEYEGELVIGHNVQIGYFEQHQAESLASDATAFDIIDQAATGEMRTKVRSLLGAFLFSGDSVYKKVRVLSGGEKSRLALAKLLLEPSNLLILDEPTNHLDMRSKDVLKQALLDYEGSLIVVSHDREFLQGLTTKVVEFKGGGIREFSGDIYEYLKARQMESLRELEARESAKQQNSQSQSRNQVDRQQRKDRDKERRRLQRRVEDAEKNIADLEKQIAQFDEKLKDPGFYASAESSKTLAAYHKCQEKLEAMMQEWSAATDDLQAFGADD